MSSVTVRNLPDEVHRALRVRAAHNGRSTEAEIREILTAAAQPAERVKLGALLASIAHHAGALTDAEANHFDSIRDQTPSEPLVVE
ncbi:Trafficking protein A [Thiorhodovibrio winogradskyi]|uniref:Trafficking protein A n=1 Tax=Thiorhodovibrio winogradskyi TaxID=77007 RepID=A0ABZ0SJC3_9GAMM|nr:plasmid stability protein stbC [Thiorhodovibrio winogradskyi]